MPVVKSTTYCTVSYSVESDNKVEFRYSGYEAFYTFTKTAYLDPPWWNPFAKTVEEVSERLCELAERDTERYRKRFKKERKASKKAKERISDRCS